MTPPAPRDTVFAPRRCGGMVDTRDLKSLAGNRVPVRVRSPAPKKRHPFGCLFFGADDPNLESGPGDGTAQRAGPSARRGFESGHLPFGMPLFAISDPDLESGPGDGTARRAAPSPRRGFESGHHPGVLLLVPMIPTSDPAPAKAQPEGLGLVPVGDSSPFLLPTFLHFRRPSNLFLPRVNLFAFFRD